MVRCRSGCSEVLRKQRNREIRHDCPETRLKTSLKRQTSTRTRSWEFSCCHPQIHRTLQKMILRIFVQALSCCVVACPHSLHLTSTSWRIQCMEEMYRNVCFNFSSPKLQTELNSELAVQWDLGKVSGNCLGQVYIVRSAQWIGRICDLICYIFLGTWNILHFFICSTTCSILINIVYPDLVVPQVSPKVPASPTSLDNDLPNLDAWHRCAVMLELLARGWSISSMSSHLGSKMKEDEAISWRPCPEINEDWFVCVFPTHS